MAGGALAIMRGAAISGLASLVFLLSFLPNAVAVPAPASCCADGFSPPWVDDFHTDTIASGAWGTTGSATISGNTLHLVETAGNTGASVNQAFSNPGTAFVVEASVTPIVVHKFNVALWPQGSTFPSSFIAVEMDPAGFCLCYNPFVDGGPSANWDTSAIFGPAPVAGTTYVLQLTLTGTHTATAKVFAADGTTLLGSISRSDATSSFFWGDVGMSVWNDNLGTLPSYNVHWIRLYTQGSTPPLVPPTPEVPTMILVGTGGVLVATVMAVGYARRNGR
jgi:hypothetical protein